MVNKAFLGKMKKDGVLINTSRGSVVNEEELLYHLDANKSFFYACDVFEGEPAEKKAKFNKVLAKHPRVYWI